MGRPANLRTRLFSLLKKIPLTLAEIILGMPITVSRRGSVTVVRQCLFWTLVICLASSLTAQDPADEAQLIDKIHRVDGAS